MLGVIDPKTSIVSKATNDPTCPSGKRASPPLQPLCISVADVQRYGVPAAYAPPGVTPTAYTPESKTGLYVGLGVGAVVVIGGLYLLFGRGD